ncbi:hypothetical protein SCRM01_197 [Synechococcus phage S-CRM01]|uniref:hypothetical protein n=1 Tax=Synechococcus phage S-CRM01 TaxID=1026955 RepID=UPI000209E416|nr:hypothetical protein SCRM01_197 [Synechococcus phage S-CRM01]AEC53143.1 hypothetical protein SCRM01_197 [Synechococcus phage S-CRM01]
MKNKNFVKGVNIIANYLNGDSYDLAAEHDKVFFGLVDDVTDPEDIKELERLGWFEEFDSWACNV